MPAKLVSKAEGDRHLGISRHIFFQVQPTRYTIFFIIVNVLHVSGGETARNM
jgi:hypothetical protein